MFNRHLLKVILGFCGMILVGLILLVVINSYKNDTSDQQAQVPIVTPPPVNKVPIKVVPKKPTHKITNLKK